MSDLQEGRLQGEGICDTEHLFTCLFATYVSFGETSIQILYSFFNQMVCVLANCCGSASQIPNMNP